jgi:hypothetical protein
VVTGPGQTGVASPVGHFGRVGNRNRPGPVTPVIVVASRLPTVKKSLLVYSLRSGITFVLFLEKQL